VSKRISRRKFVQDVAIGALGVAAGRTVHVQAAPTFDLIIRGATILDGTGAPAYAADLGIIGDRIAAIGTISPDQGKRTIDASGLHATPGFIDIHTHSDTRIFRYPTADSRVRQGITTEVTGNCGSSAAPIDGPRADERRANLSRDLERPVSWSGVDSYLKALQANGLSINHALLLGQGTLRSNAIGVVDRRLTEDELKGVLRALEQGLDDGAFGLSTGLEYTPGRYTPTDEIVAMARIVARSGGVYTSHIRNEEAGLLESVNEAINIGRQSGARVEISHLKSAGRPNWPMQTAAIDLIESARRQGVEVLADAYPYTAYSTGLTIFVSSWALDGGWPALARRLRDQADRARIRSEMLERVRNEPGDYELIVISSVDSESDRDVVGRNVADIAKTWRVEPVDAILRLLEQNDGDVGYIGHAMSPENVALVLRHPLVMIGSDGYSMAPEGPAAKTRPHPRSYGTYPRVLGYYARDERLFDLPTAVRKMTSMPADQTGLRDRGRLARGKKADVVLFDAKNIRDVATFDDPHRYPNGIPYVIVNGQVVVDQGRHTGAKPGRVLRSG
jgi:N-acyl-D-amino-acid deacylase